MVSAPGPITHLAFRFDGTASSADPASTTVGVNHSWIGDLIFKLKSPLGTTVTFFDRPGVPTTTVGCNSNNLFNLTLDDWAALPVENQCGVDTNAGPLTGAFTPNNPLAAFNGENPNGTWTLTASDNAGSDTGSVRAWSLLISAACARRHRRLRPSQAPSPTARTRVCPPIPGVTMTLTGSSSGSTTTDGSGNYSFTGLLAGNNYTVTPSKAPITPGGPGSSNISTVDVLAIQKHFLIIGTPLSGCRLSAADCAPPVGIGTVDVLAAQKFFLQLAGFANVGKYGFTPASRSYSPLDWRSDRSELRHVRLRRRHCRICPSSGWWWRRRGQPRGSFHGRSGDASENRRRSIQNQLRRRGEDFGNKCDEQSGWIPG